MNNIKKIRISFKALEAFLKGDWKMFNSNLPKDTKILRVYDEVMQNPAYVRSILVVVIQSKEFPELEENKLIPDFDLIMETK